MADVTLKSYAPEVLAALKKQVRDALDIIGTQAEQHAAALTPTGKIYGGTLKQGWTHVVDDNTVAVGNNVHYAPYVELGTGNKYEPPPEWLEFQAKKGRGLDHWVYFDDKLGEFRTGYPQAGKHMLKHAIEDHMNEYKGIIEATLEGK